LRLAPPWKLKRSDLRKIYNAYAMAIETDAALLTEPTDVEKLWIPESLRLKRAGHVEIAKMFNAAFLETLVALFHVFLSPPCHIHCFSQFLFCLTIYVVTM